MKIAIASYACGSSHYIERAERSYRDNWLYWCERHGYKCFFYSEPLDPTMHRSNLQMQKLLIFDKLRSFDAVIYIDNDIVINPNAPPFPIARPDRLLRAVPHIPWEGVQGYANRFGLKFSSLAIPFGGVTCLSDKKDYELMKKIYFGKELDQDHPIHSPDMLLVGMPFLKSGRIQWIDQRWNYVPNQAAELPKPRYLSLPMPGRVRSFLEKSNLQSPRSGAFITRNLSNCFFMHFAGDLKPYIPLAVEAAIDLRPCV